MEKDHRIAVEVLSADLSRAEDLEKVEVRLREDRRITGLVNNAGIAGEGAITALDPAYVTTMINLNILAVTRLAAAIAPRLAADGGGTIINITSVTALMPAAFTAVYPATKAFVLAFTEALQAQLSPSGVRVQAVLPGITRTAIWEEGTARCHSGRHGHGCLRDGGCGPCRSRPRRSADHSFLPDTADLEKFPCSARGVKAQSVACTCRQPVSCSQNRIEGDVS